MEVIYLLFSLVTASFTSLALSILLLLRTVFTRLLSLAVTAKSSSSNSSGVSLYEGTVWHERRRPVHHSFRYSVRYALYDLDRATNAPPDHLSAEEARQATQTTGPVLLLTIPPNVGYEQNPLSVYYCHDIEGAKPCLKKCIAEVTNTPWGERVTFVFNPNSDLVAKPLHVSPFMDMMGSWSIRTNLSGDSLSVFISVQHPELGNYFVASLKAKRIPSELVPEHALFFWLMPHKVAFWIYWQALQLWWEKVQFISHSRYTNPAYREEALVHDEKLRCSGELALEKNEHLQTEHHPGNPSDGGFSRQRLFRWRDAKWPWN